MSSKINGWKTYIVAALTIAGFWGAYFSGAADAETTIQATIAAVLAATVRHGIKTEAERTKQ